MSDNMLADLLCEVDACGLLSERPAPDEHNDHGSHNERAHMPPRQDSLFVEIAGGLTIQTPGRPDRAGRRSVELYNGHGIYSAAINLALDAERQKWVTRACATYPALGRDEALQALQSLAFSVAELQRRPTGPSAGDADDQRPWIDGLDGDLKAASAAAWGAIVASNEPPALFSYGDQLARVDMAAHGPVVRDLDAIGLRYELAERSRCYKDTGQGRAVVYPPVALCQHMLSAPSYPLPRLTRVVEAPVIAPDGTLQTTAGYHPAAGVYYHPPRDLDLPAVSDHPSDAEIRRARNLILVDLLGDFPFAGDAERANIVAAIVQPFVRDLIDGPTPLHLIEAPAPGTGKGLLADVALIPAMGRNVAVISPAAGDEEWRKRITAQAIEAPTAVLIDNITRSLDSGVLAAALTATTWKDRRLGHSSTITVPIRCVWLATANNPTLSTEIARRVVRTRLTPQDDRPWQRPADSFRHCDLRGWAHAHRGEIVWSVLTLIRAWLVAGRPATAAVLGSYERWSAVVGGILATAGIEGFLCNVDDLYESSDREGAVWRAFVAAWWDAHGDEKVKVADLMSLAVETDGLDLGRGDHRSQKIALGMAIARQRDRVISAPDGCKYRIIQAGLMRHAVLWQLVKV